MEKGEKLSQSETLRIETVNGARRRGLQKKKKHTHGALWRGESVPRSSFGLLFGDLAFHSSKPFQQGAMESGDENQPYLNFLLMYIIVDTQGLRLGARSKKI